MRRCLPLADRPLAAPPPPPQKWSVNASKSGICNREKIVLTVNKAKFNRRMVPKKEKYQIDILNRCERGERVFLSHVSTNFLFFFCVFLIFSLGGHSVFLSLSTEGNLYIYSLEHGSSLFGHEMWSLDDTKKEQRLEWQFYTIFQLAKWIPTFPPPSSPPLSDDILRRKVIVCLRTER